MIVPGDIYGERLAITLDAEDGRAIASALEWTLAHHTDLEHMLMLDQDAAVALAARVRPGDDLPRTTVVQQAELLAVVLALALAADGPFATDVRTLTGLDESAYRDRVTASSSIFQVWLAGGLRGARSAFAEGDIVRIARASAAGKRDPLPSLVQYSFGTREHATRVADAGIVFSDAPSYLVAIHGRFCAPSAHPPSRPPREPLTRYTVQILILDARSGRITDAGGGNIYPDLAQLGEATTAFIHPG